MPATSPASSNSEHTHRARSPDSSTLSIISSIQISRLVHITTKSQFTAGRVFSRYITLRTLIADIKQISLSDSRLVKGVHYFIYAVLACDAGVLGYESIQPANDDQDADYLVDVLHTTGIPTVLCTQNYPFFYPSVHEIRGGPSRGSAQQGDPIDSYSSNTPGLLPGRTFISSRPRTHARKWVCVCWKKAWIHPSFRGCPREVLLVRIPVCTPAVHWTSARTP